MPKLNLIEYYKQFKDQNILLSFNGAVSQELLVEMGVLVKNQVGVRTRIKKLFSVFVEVSQNIMHYSAIKEKHDGKDIGVGIIVFTEDEEYFYIHSGNPIKKEIGNKIKDKVDYINSLSKEELKNLYHERRKLPAESESKGAGLGLIDIVRKSENPIEYEIKPLDNQMNFLHLSVRLKKEA